MWLLMALEQPTLSAVIARLPEPKLNLAAWGLTFALALIVESPVIMFLTLSTALARSQQSYRLLMRFVHLLAWGLMALHLFIAVTPLYGLIVGGLVGAPPAVVEPSRMAFLLMVPWSGAIAYRRFWHGVMIRHGRTAAVSISTAIRLATTATVALAGLAVNTNPDAALAGLPIGTLPGASLAGLAVSAGVIADAVAAFALSRKTVRYQVPANPPSVPILTWPYLLRFYLPLAMTSFITLAGQPIVSLGLSRSPMPLESLAVWPVINGLLFLARSGGVALQEVVVALLADLQSYQALRRFSYTLALALTTFMAVVTLTPLANLWFRGVAGLSPELAALARQGALMLVLVPGLTALISWQRGALIHFGRTGAITIATVVNILVLLAAVLAGSRLLPFPGVITAALALTASLAAEVTYLTHQSRFTRRTYVWA